MKNGNLVWRSSCLLCALLLTTLLAPETEGENANANLRYGDGKEYKTDFSDAHLLGELSVRGNGPVLVYSGHPAKRCTPPDCDAETTVYLQPTSGEPDQGYGLSLRYPGNYYSKESGKLVARVQMFIGRCIDSREGVAWFIENQDDSAHQQASLLATGVHFAFVNEDHSGGRFFASLAFESPANLNISVAEAAVSNHTCREITPLQQFYRASAQYKGPDTTDLQLRLYGSTPNSEVKRWIKFVSTMPPARRYPVVFFSQQEFKTAGSPNESLIVLSRSQFEQLANLTDSQRCSSVSSNEYHVGGLVTQYKNRQEHVCWLQQSAACAYLTAISTLPIGWKPTQSKSIQDLSWDTYCKSSGRPEYRGKSKRELELWETEHPINPTGSSTPKQPSSSGR